MLAGSRSALHEDRQAMAETEITEADVLELVEPRFASVLESMAWFDTEALPGFSGLTARKLVEQGHGAEVINYVRAVDAGLHA